MFAPFHQTLTRTSRSQPYSVTKAAQIHLVKCLARITSPKIRVNSVSPGILMTVSAEMDHTECSRFFNSD